ncbi:hypothetical protein M885DRAFT_610969 [Pelagophyceae sp. CCMP2097]|nr:hypothetical protein M885DRAFT_610969 [Pelagophyceae sp. CCMP2097]
MLVLEARPAGVAAAPAAVPARRAKAPLQRSLPLVLGKRAAAESRSTIFVEVDGAAGCAETQGAIGRVEFGEGDAFFLDVRGSVYEANIVAGNTLFVVAVGRDSANIECISSEHATTRRVMDHIEMMHGTVVGGGLEEADGCGAAEAAKPQPAKRKRQTAKPAKQGTARR